MILEDLIFDDTKTLEVLVIFNFEKNEDVTWKVAIKLNMYWQWKKYSNFCADFAVWSPPASCPMPA